MIGSWINSVDTKKWEYLTSTLSNQPVVRVLLSRLREYFDEIRRAPVFAITNKPHLQTNTLPYTTRELPHTCGRSGTCKCVGLFLFRTWKRILEQMISDTFREHACLFCDFCSRRRFPQMFIFSWKWFLWQPPLIPAVDPLEATYLGYNPTSRIDANSLLQNVCMKNDSFKVEMDMHVFPSLI